MLSKQAFVEKLHSWDDLFPKEVLSSAYDKLSTDVENKRYVVAVVDSLNPDFTVSQTSTKELGSKLTELISNYRTKTVAYIPRILIVNLLTGEEFRDPTQWKQFLYLNN